MKEGFVIGITIIFLSGVGGATLMVLFLKLINYNIKPGVRVPLILGQVVHHYLNGAPFYNLRHKYKIGFGIHLLVGVVFAFCYAGLWHRGIGGPYLVDILVFGFINGLVGVTGWWVFLKSTYEPEQVEKRYFFPVLILAHLVFALGVTFIYFSLWDLYEML